MRYTNTHKITTITHKITTITHKITTIAWTEKVTCTGNSLFPFWNSKRIWVKFFIESTL